MKYKDPVWNIQKIYKEARTKITSTIGVIEKNLLESCIFINMVLETYTAYTLTTNLSTWANWNLHLRSNFDSWFRKYVLTCVEILETDGQALMICLWLLPFSLQYTLISWQGKLSIEKYTQNSKEFVQYFIQYFFATYLCMLTIYVSNSWFFTFLLIDLSIVKNSLGSTDYQKNLTFSLFPWSTLIKSKLVLAWQG